MKSLSIMVFLILETFFFSCNRIINHKECKINKIEVFSVGFPNIIFPIDQYEKDVRKNPRGLILDKKRLEKIEMLILNLKDCKQEKDYIGSIMGVCDVYCKDSKKYTILYDQFSLIINENFYCVNNELLDELFRKKTNQSR